jgi:hypothetical protein
MPFQGPPPLCILYFLMTPPLVPLENIVLYCWLARLGQSLGEQVINEEY